MLLKLFLGATVFFHGIIHLIGFMRAFFPEKVKIEGRPVGKPLGLVWLLTVLLFLASLAMWLMKYDDWTWVCLIAVALSQFLIFVYWKEAKFGTLANLILLGWAWPQYAYNQFEQMLQSEYQEIRNSATAPAKDTMREQQLEGLPYIVQHWLRQSGVVGKPSISYATLRQTGHMILQSESTKKFDFEALEYFNVKNPAFLWHTRVYYASWLSIAVRDKWMDGTGAMLVKVIDLIKAVDEKDTEQMNKASALRFLGEICWVPSAALEPYLTWEEIDSLSAKVTMKQYGKEVTGTFFFTEDGKVESFEAIRFFSSNDPREYPWQVVVQEYNSFEGYTIPARCLVTWKLPSGNFTWMELRVTDMVVNRWQDSPL